MTKLQIINAQQEVQILVAEAANQINNSTLFQQRQPSQNVAKKLTSPKKKQTLSLLTPMQSTHRNSVDPTKHIPMGWTQPNLTNTDSLCILKGF